MDQWGEYAEAGKAVEWPYPVSYGEEKEINTDVLVLGGGIAGCNQQEQCNEHREQEGSHGTTGGEQAPDNRFFSNSHIRSLLPARTRPAMRWPRPRNGR